MKTVIQALKECVAQIRKLESWLEAAGEFAEREQFLVQLQSMREEIEHLIQEAP